MTSHPQLTGEGDCFAAGTLVRTPRGLFPIERLVVDDEVISSDGCISRIVTAHQSATRDLVRVCVSDGTPVLATPWHRFFDLHGDLCHADRLRAGTSLRRNGAVVQVTRVDRVALEGPVSVYNLSLSRGVSFFANGLLVEAPHQARVLRGRSLLGTDERGAA